MESINNLSHLDIQYQNLFGTKKFRYSAESRPMDGPDDDLEEDLDGVKLRCRALVRLYADGNSTNFAGDIGVEYKAWNATENSGLLSKNVAFRIIAKHRGISLRWLWFGDTDTQAPTITRQLDKAMRQVVGEPQSATGAHKKRQRAS